jgi:hypothetical protein
MPIKAHPDIPKPRSIKKPTLKEWGKSHKTKGRCAARACEHARAHATFPASKAPKKVAPPTGVPSTAAQRVKDVRGPAGSHATVAQSLRCAARRRRCAGGRAPVRKARPCAARAAAYEAAARPTESQQTKLPAGCRAISAAGSRPTGAGCCAAPLRAGRRPQREEAHATKKKAARTSPVQQAPAPDHGARLGAGRRSRQQDAAPSERRGAAQQARGAALRRCERGAGRKGRRRARQGRAHSPEQQAPAPDHGARLGAGGRSRQQGAAPSERPEAAQQARGSALRGSTWGVGAQGGRARSACALPLDSARSRPRPPRAQVMQGDIAL